MLPFETIISFPLYCLPVRSIELRYNELFTFLTHSTHQNNSWVTLGKRRYGVIGEGAEGFPGHADQERKQEEY
jgi:hypothetical protein